VSFLVASDGYAPNEQYSGSQLQPATDIYAVGATLYFSITGRVPADAPIRANAVIDGLADPLLPTSQVARAGAFPAPFLQAIDAALSMRAATRPHTVREFQQRLFAPAPPEPRYEPPIDKMPPVAPIASTPVPASGTNWTPILVGVGAVIALLLGVVALKMPVGVSSVPVTTAQTNAALVNLQQQNALQDARNQADAITRQAEIAAQQRLEEAQQQATQTELSAQQAAETAQRQQASNSKQAEKAAKDELVGFFNRYYRALDTSDVGTFATLWDGNAPQASKAIKLISERAANGYRGRGCAINNISLNSLSSTHTRASIYINATCDRDGNKADTFRSTFELEKNALDQWKLIRQTSN